MVADTGSAGLRPPVGHEDHARLDELEAVEELSDLGHRPELRPADALPHLLLQGGRGRVLGVEQVVDEHVAAAGSARYSVPVTGAGSSSSRM